MTPNEMRICYPGFAAKEEALKFAAKKLRDRAEWYLPQWSMSATHPFWRWKIAGELRKIADELEGNTTND